MKLDRFSKFAWFVMIFNMAVILWGALVRASGSGAGCGSHWPLCQGEVIPLAPQIQTAIEFAHRVSSGTALLLVLGMVVWAWRVFPKGHRVRAGAVAVVIGMFAESIAGAGLVLFNWTAMNISLGRIIIMPVHLVVTFYLLGALTLTAWWASGGAAMRLRGQGTTLWMVALGLLGTLVMAMAGAVTALGDTVLPVSSLNQAALDALTPAGQLLVDLRVWHPWVAVGIGAYLLFLVNRMRMSSRNIFVTRFAFALGILFVVELGAGVLNIWLLVPIWMQLFHLLLANLVWIVMVLLSAATLAQDPQPQAQPVRAVEK